MQIKKDEATEELIRNTAMHLFFGEGRFNATTQEIADAAGVNRTLINYYFRSRDKLFEQVFTAAQEEEQRRTANVVFSELPFREKIAQFIDDSFEMAKKYPYLEIYLVTQFNQGCYFKDEEAMERMIAQFYQEVEAEMDKGTIARMEPVQFLLNMVSLISFPISMRPLFQKTMRLTDAAYEHILAQRKSIIMAALFKSLLILITLAI